MAEPNRITSDDLAKVRERVDKRWSELTPDERIMADLADTIAALDAELARYKKAMAANLITSDKQEDRELEAEAKLAEVVASIEKTADGYVTANDTLQIRVAELEDAGLRLLTHEGLRGTIGSEQREDYRVVFSPPAKAGA